MWCQFWSVSIVTCLKTYMERALPTELREWARPHSFQLSTWCSGLVGGKYRIRTTHPISIKQGGYIPLAMSQIWLNFRIFLWEKILLLHFFISCSVIPLSNILLEGLDRLIWNENWFHGLNTWSNVWSWPMSSLVNLALEFIGHISKYPHLSGMLGPIGVEGKRLEPIESWTHYVTLNFDFPFDLDTVVCILTFKF